MKLNMNKKILLTGHEGFIGSNMKLRLTQLGYDVFGVEMDDEIPNLYGFDLVMHLGAISATTETNVEKIMKYNYEYSLDLLYRCECLGIPMQFASSASVYGLKREFKEDSPVDPRTPYAWSKYMFEKYVELHPPLDNTIQMFRYFNVYGPNEEHKGTQASPYCQFTQQAINNGKIKLFENSENYHRDFIPVEKIIDTHIKFMYLYTSGVFNIGTGETKSFQDVAEEIATRFNVPIEYIPMPENLKHSYQEYTCADMTKTNKTLGR